MTWNALKSIAVAFPLLMAAAAACYTGPNLDPTPYAALDASVGSTCTPDLESIQRTIFGRACTQSGCHGTADHAAGLNLAAADLAAQLIDQPAGCGETPLVKAGSPEQSALYQKVAGGACGALMPIGGAELSPGDKSCIREWIVNAKGSIVDAGPDASCGDTQSSPANCGSCGNACPTSAACVDAKCTCPTTQSTVCANACVDTQTDPKNCGSCGKVCPSNAKYCVAGACSNACALTACPDGSCVDTASSFANCGACGRSCVSGQNCTTGVCACPSGSMVCGGTCVPVNTTTNCGSCGNACSIGQTCTGGTCTCGSSSVSFAAAVQPILTANCASVGCHVKGAGTNVKGLDLSAGSAYANMVNKPAVECSDGRLLVKPTAPNVSYVMQKIVNVNLCGTGTQMPKKGTSLSTADITTISNWICAGAPNN